MNLFAEIGTTLYHNLLFFEVGPKYVSIPFLVEALNNLYSRHMQSGERRCWMVECCPLCSVGDRKSGKGGLNCAKLARVCVREGELELKCVFFLEGGTTGTTMRQVTAERVRRSTGSRLAAECWSVCSCVTGSVSPLL